MKENKKNRVRFAPSPTGNLHIGATRVALFNYLFAKRTDGVFVLRIEDTDKIRSKKEYEDDIMRSLEWLGITWDEGPFYQSQRTDIYKKHLLYLLENKKIYRCFCTKEELEERKEKQRNRKEAPRYEGKCFSLTQEEEEKLIKDGKDFVFRLRVPENQKLTFEDEIKGSVIFNTGDIGGDFVVARSDYSALYNFVCVVDDFEMKITHVIRGEDHISNTPKQILIGNALNLPIPKFAHCAILLGPDRSKLSKRHGATSIDEYREEGYLAKALVNFMALLGWHPGGDEEIYEIEEIIAKFSFTDCQKSGAVFDVKKLDYINGQHIRRMNLDDFTSLCVPYLLDAGFISASFKEEQHPPAYGGFTPQSVYYSKDGKEISFERLKQITSLYQERVKKLSEVKDFLDYFFCEKVDYEKEMLFWKDAKEEETIAALEKAIETVNSLDKWEKEIIYQQLLDTANQKKDRGAFLWPLRVALTGKRASASPFDIVWVLGPELTIKRLKTAKNKLITTK
jgi:nondiscriminating glutamyl-tRNA synthetase